MDTSPAAPGSELLTTREVAELLRVSRATVARWAQDGILNAVRPSPKILRFRRSEVDALLDNGSAA